MKEMSNVIRTMPKSGIRQVQDLMQDVSSCIRLETGEPNFTTPPYICEGAAQAMREGLTQYTPILGYPSVRQAIAEDYSRKLGSPVEESQVIVTTGSTMALYNALLVLTEKEDEILIPDPCWPTYRMQIHSLGLKAVPYLLDENNGMCPTKEGIESCITPRTKVMIANSPSNPTGVMFDEATVRMIMEVARAHDLYVISDEVYDFLTYDGRTHVSLKSFDTDGRVILVGGASKKYAMTGWRVGCAIADREIISLMGQAMIIDGGNCCSIAQKAYETALRGPQDFVSDCVESYRARRDAVMKICRDAEVSFFVPQGAFYLWIDITKSGMTAQEFSTRLFEKHLVSVVAGDSFGKSGAGKIRISLATEMEQLCKGVNMICDFINGII